MVEDELKDEEDPPYSSNQSLDIALDEARRKYNEEEQRRTSIESKSSIVIGINALIASLVTAVTDDVMLILILLAVPITMSTVFGLKILQIQEYNRPGKETKDFYQYSTKERAEVHDELLISYINAIAGDPDRDIAGNKEKNDYKIKLFQKSYSLTVTSVILIISVPVFEFLIEIVQGHICLVGLMYLVAAVLAYTLYSLFEHGSVEGPRKLINDLTSIYNQ